MKKSIGEGDEEDRGDPVRVGVAIEPTFLPSNLSQKQKDRLPLDPIGQRIIIAIA